MTYVLSQSVWVTREFYIIAVLTITGSQNNFMLCDDASVRPKKERSCLIFSGEIRTWFLSDLKFIYKQHFSFAVVLEAGSNMVCMRV